MNRIAFLLMFWIVLSYNVNADPGQTSISTTTQYGTPFTGVPDSRDASIYQVNIRCFSATHDFNGVTKRLDHIKALGINVIYLMPIYPVGQVKSINSPYCIKDYESIAPEFGTLNDLRALIDEAHSRNMAVILDFVANHTSWDHTWITQHPSWYQHDASGEIISPFDWKDIAQLDFTNQDMRKALIKAMKYWVYTVNCDGFRCDYADGPPADFWKQAIDTLRSIATHKLLMLAEGTRNSNYSAGFDYNFGFNFYGKLKGIYTSNSSVTKIDSLNISDYTGTSGGQQMIRYVTNHDVNSSDGTPLDLFGGKTGSMAAFVVVSYMKGVPFVYNGQEVATPIRMTFPFTSTTIDWTINPEVTAEYAKIISFRNNSTTIRRGSLTSFSSDDVCAFTKTLGTETVLVLSNLRNTTVNYTVPTGLVSTKWNDVFKGTAITVGNQFIMQPYSYVVLKNTISKR